MLGFVLDDVFLGHRAPSGHPERPARAEAVRDWLVAHGVDSSRLEPHGYGDSNPIAPNITASGRARNRRVEILIQRLKRPLPTTSGVTFP